MSNYSVIFYETASGKCPVKEYLEKLSDKEIAKIFAYINLLKEKNGYLDEPYSKHIIQKIRELRIKRHRVFYSVIVEKQIILLHAFLKNTSQTPEKEINKALKYYNDFISREGAQ